MHESNSVDDVRPVTQSSDVLQSRDQHHDEPVSTSEAAERVDARSCPWCGSRELRLIQRGLVGPTDERDQYIVCQDCDRLTFEIVSRTLRDLRVSQFRAGDEFRDSARQTRYRIQRVLKVGMNEVLLYLKPISRRVLRGPEPD